VSFTAAEALNEIEKLRGDHSKFNGGLMINKQYKLIVVGASLKSSMKADSAQQIIEVCKIHAVSSKYNPILVSKDKALRLLAAAQDISAEDYRYDAAESVYQGLEYTENDVYDVEKLSVDQKIANRFFLGRSKKLQVFFNGKLQLIEKNGKHKFNFHGITAKNDEQISALWALTNPNIKFVSLQGKAGCGKTLLSLVAGIQALSDPNSSHEKIIVTRAMESVDGKPLGALPGNAEEKISPYMDGIWDNLNLIKRYIEKINFQGKDLEKKNSFESKIEATPFDLMRGRSLSNVWLIIDEGQNISAHAMKTLLTRVDDSSKVIIMGDNDQIDHPYLDSRSNGMVRAINHFKGHPQAAHITLLSNERGDISNFASKM